MEEENKYEDVLGVACSNCGNYGHIICGFLDNSPTIKELEAKNVELEKDLNNYIRDHGQLLIEKATLEKKLEIAVEALEYIVTYKHPDYFSYSRGSVFDVSKQALVAINGDTYTYSREHFNDIANGRD